MISKTKTQLEKNTTNQNTDLEKCIYSLLLGFLLGLSLSVQLTFSYSVSLSLNPTQFLSQTDSVSLSNCFPNFFKLEIWVGVISLFWYKGRGMNFLMVFFFFFGLEWFLNGFFFFRFFFFHFIPNFFFKIKK